MKTDLGEEQALGLVNGEFKEQVLLGLTTNPKQLPCKFFYDERGSALFEQICELDEYYLTRTETGILRDNLEEIVAFCGPECLLVELGSGSSNKTRLLLDRLDRPAAYVPIDISLAQLRRAAQALASDYFQLEILPLCADYHRPLTLPRPARPPRRTLVFFPGSTIGNFDPIEAVVFLRRIAARCHPGDAILVGVDLAKDPPTLERAYNDLRGVTARFNLNILARANRELGANFDLDQFQHRAVFNQSASRIEMRLVSRRGQSVAIDGRRIPFYPAECITTELSYKYRPERFARLAHQAGLRVRQTWTDPRHWFSLWLLLI